MNGGVFGSLFGAVLMFLAGLVVGVAVSDTDILNPNTSAATAQSIDTQNSFEQKKNDIELKKLEELSALDVEAKRQEHAQALEEMRRDAELRRDVIRLGSTVLIPVTAGCLLVLSIAATYYLVSRAKGQQSPSKDVFPRHTGKREAVVMGVPEVQADRLHTSHAVGTDRGDRVVNA